MGQVQLLNKCSVFHQVQYPITSKLIRNIQTKPAYLMKCSTHRPTFKSARNGIL